MVEKKIIVTSALPYANGPIHIGHLVEYIQTDIFVRFLRLIGKNVVYCCADDTHGTPIQISAEKEGVTPESLIEKYHREHLRDFTKFFVEFDSYYSTNSKENKYFSNLIFSRLKNKGLIYKKAVELAFCPKCNRFLPDRYIKGKCPKCGKEDQYGDVCEECNATYRTTDLIDPYCIICGERPQKRTSHHYFFKLSQFSGRLMKWFDGNKRLQPEVVNYLKNWIKEGLQDWDISRDGPYFGFKIPGEDNLYYYVWLDAPIGYISSFANFVGNDVKKAEDEWNKSTIVHFIGKDIIYFHFLFWPAMLMGADFRLPDNLVVHGFLTVNGEKMSKSRGTFFTAEEFAEKYNPEYLRFYYAKVLSRKLADVDLNFDDFRKSINNELVGNVGNFCYRVLSFINKFFNSELGEIEDNSKLIANINQMIEKIKQSYEELNYNEVVKNILAISDLGNRYFQKQEPWKLIRSDKEKAHKVTTLCVNIVKNLSILIQPILPNFSGRLQNQLGLDNLEWSNINFNFKNKKIGSAEIILSKMEKPADEEKEYFPLDLRVARVEKVRNHPEADKLYILDIDVGEKRQIISGLKDFYTKEELEGKNIILVKNLRPAKFKGILSQGMLLAAEKGDKCKVLFVEGKPGQEVRFGDLNNSKDEISFDRFKKINMVVKNNKVFYNNFALNVSGKEVRINIEDGALVR